MAKFCRTLCMLGTISVMGMLSESVFANTYIRYNHAGYSLERDKKIIVMADEDQSNTSWSLLKNNVSVSSGTLGVSLAAVTGHTPKPFNYLIDISSVKEPGDYVLNIAGGDSAAFSLQKDPYTFMATEILTHMKAMRSGTTDTVNYRSASHLGDAKAIVYIPDGAVAQGKWKPEGTGRTVDMKGGWYDAGDYIKFTLTNAHTAYYLLRAYQERPQIYTKVNSRSHLVDILDEAKFGLDYLLKTMPSENEFIIQVSTGLDHNEGLRLPKDDARDGAREALSALSPGHMGLTAAALALGSEVFSSIGETQLAQSYLNKAKQIYARSQMADVLTANAFERDATNDFYRDDNVEDNLGLGAIELYIATKDNAYLTQAKAYADKAGGGYWASWGKLNISLNYRISPYHATAANVFGYEMDNFDKFDKNAGNIWGIPMKAYWGPLHGAFIASAYSGLRHLKTPKQKVGGIKPTAKLLYDNIDYSLGRNNWGVSFISSENIPKSVFHSYSQLYRVTGFYPTGAVALGPGDTGIYQSLLQYFEARSYDEDYKPFNTTAEVFFDNETNFQSTEAVIYGQSAALYALSVLAKIEGFSNVGGNLKPSISVSKPGNLTEGDMAVFNATASDSDGSINQVEFFVDNLSIGVETASPYESSWTAIKGPHTLKAVATDNQGASNSAFVDFNVVSATNNLPPEVSVTTPSGLKSGDNALLSASALDSDGMLTQVEFFIDSISVGIDTSAPYAMNWTATDGTHSLTAVATDNEAASTKSAPATFTVEPATVKTLACSVRENVWNVGYTAYITVTNTGNTAVNTWEISLALGENDTFVSGWSAIFNSPTSPTKASNMPWNGTIAPGASATFGFLASYTGTHSPVTCQ